METFDEAIFPRLPRRDESRADMIILKPSFNFRFGHFKPRMRKLSKLAE